MTNDRFLTPDLWLDETANWDDVVVKRPPPSEGGAVLRLDNDRGRPVDEGELRRKLSKLKGVKWVDLLVIEPSSRVKDLSFLDAVPGLRALIVYGRSIQTLEGIERFSGMSIHIACQRKGRDISKLAQARVKKLVVQWGDAGDLDVLGRCTSAVSLDLVRFPDVDIAKLRRVRLETLFVTACGIRELRDTAKVRALRGLHVAGCRKLEGFGGDNRLVEVLTVDNCHEVDVGSCRSFSHLRVLRLHTKRQFPLRSLAGFTHLEELTLGDCRNVRFGRALDLKCPKLEHLSIDPMTKPQALALSRANVGVLVNFEFRDGVRIPRPANPRTKC